MMYVETHSVFTNDGKQVGDLEKHSDGWKLVTYDTIPLSAIDLTSITTILNELNTADNTKATNKFAH